jgi:hypothetical protein
VIAGFRRLLSSWRGEGAGSATVPPMDGVLSPNQAIEEAPVIVTAEAPDNLASDGRRVLYSTGSVVMALTANGTAASTQNFAGFEQPVSALALHPDGAVAIGMAGQVLLRGGAHGGKVLTTAGDRRMLCPTALLFADANTLLVTLGSQQNEPEAWKHDLMQRNASGSVWKIDLGSGAATCLGDRLAYPNGLLLARDGSLTVSESWRNQVVRLRTDERPTTLLADITGYPARLSPTADGTGAWLAVFAPRSQLIEFVLREPDYRKSMMAELDPQFWIAPSLSPTQSFLEPMQFGGLKQLGQLKAWAPTRSYGLVVRLDGESEPQESFHSRADGRRHGVTSCLELGGRLLATAKGGNAIVSIPVAAAGRGQQR